MENSVCVCVCVCSFPITFLEYCYFSSYITNTYCFKQEISKISHTEFIYSLFF